MSPLLDPRNSSFREKFLEHIFVGDLLRCLVGKDIVEVEVLRAEVDSGGYDLVVECRKTIRHIQLKSTHSRGVAASQSIHLRLGQKLSGCVVWIIFDPETLKLGPFRFFGNPPGQPLPDITKFPTAKHAKGNAVGTKTERPNVRVVKKSQFEEVDDMAKLVEKLFGI